MERKTEMTTLSNTDLEEIEKRYLRYIEIDKMPREQQQSLDFDEWWLPTEQGQVAFVAIEEDIPRLIAALREIQYSFDVNMELKKIADQERELFRKERDEARAYADNLIDNNCIGIEIPCRPWGEVQMTEAIRKESPTPSEEK